ncbi:MAG: ABC transporter ATP-binding protein [Bryobacteraceae bacterium]
MLEALELTKRYPGVTAVDHVSFAMRPYEVLGYLGPNGSGKSTTVHMLTGLVEPTSGQVLFHGRPIKDDLIGYKRRLGYVPEEPRLYPYLSGKEYLQLVARLRQLPQRRAEEKIDEMLRLFSLRESRFSLIGSYSKGMRQKVLIAAALLHNPDVIIFDEPLSGLDVTTGLVFRSLVKRLSAQGKTILYSSHVLEVVEKVCSHALILRQGRAVAHDSVEHLRYLMSLPSLEDIFSQLVVAEDTEQIARGIAEAVSA